MAAVKGTAEAVEWLPTITAFAGALLGGALTSMIQTRRADRNRRIANKSDKLGEIAVLSTECEAHVLAEQHTNTYKTFMLAASRSVRNPDVDHDIGDWVPEPKSLPQKTLELENLIRQFLPEQEAAAREIRKMEGQFLAMFADIQKKVLAAQPSDIDVVRIGLLCGNTTKPLLDRIRVAHDNLRKAAIFEKRQYD